MSWEVPPADWLILQLPTAQAGPRNSDKKAQQNLATLLQPHSVLRLNIRGEAFDKYDSFSSLAPRTGCSAISVPTLILNNLFISGPIIKLFNSMKVEMIRIYLVYKTPCQVQFLSIYDHHDFWQKNYPFCLLSRTVTGVNVTRVTLSSVIVFNMVRNPKSYHQKF